MGPEGADIAPWPRLWAWAAAAAPLTMLGAWLGGESLIEAYSPPNPRAVLGADARQLAGERASAESRNSAVAFGLLGGLLGTTMGLAGGLARRRPLGGARASAIGLVTGSALAVAAVFRRSFDPAAPSLVLPLLAHGIIFATIGAGGGLALGFGLGEGVRRPRAMLGGFLGAGVGVLAFELLIAGAFPLLVVDQPMLPTRGSRLLCDVCLVASAALGSTFAVSRPSRTRRAPSLS
jgi:hypothetical protein